MPSLQENPCPAQSDPESSPHTVINRPQPLDPILTIQNFCKWATISRWKYNDLKRKGTGPKCLLSGRRVLITQKAALDWLESLESGGQA